MAHLRCKPAASQGGVRELELAKRKLNDLNLHMFTFPKILK